MRRLKIPLWLKIFATLTVVSIVLTVLGAISYDLIGPILVLVPLVCPRKDRDNPTLVWIIPWFWGLEVAGSLFFLYLAMAGKSFAAEDARQPTMVEILSGLFLLPPLIWLLATRHRLFKPALLLATFIFVTTSFWVYGNSLGDTKAKLELGGDLFTQAIVTAYLCFKVKPRTTPTA